MRRRSRDEDHFSAPMGRGTASRGARDGERRFAPLRVRTGGHGRGNHRLGRDHDVSGERGEQAHRGRHQRGFGAGCGGGRVADRGDLEQAVPAVHLHGHPGRDQRHDQRHRHRAVGHPRQGARAAGVQAAWRRGAGQGRPVHPPAEARHAGEGGGGRAGNRSVGPPGAEARPVLGGDGGQVDLLPGRADTAGDGGQGGGDCRGDTRGGWARRSRC